MIPTASILIVEANSLAFKLEGRGRETGAALGSHRFRFGIDHPNLGATARPAALAYSWLIGRARRGRGCAPGQTALLTASGVSAAIPAGARRTLDGIGR